MIETLTEKTARAVEDGLSSNRKFLPSWLFYDENGDRIFQEIMAMPEYYLTGCEYEILDRYKSELQHEFSKYGKFNLIELGPGDGLKTEILLRHFQSNAIPFSYSPIDISAAVLVQLENRLKQLLPGLDYNPQQGDYTEVLAHLEQQTHERKIILFLGANIGNLPLPDAIEFLTSIASHMNPRDLLVLGVDLQKDSQLIMNAYDDPHGITKRFNLNLLTRLNRELGATFDLDKFEHKPSYNPRTGVASSYLVSKESQAVYIHALSKQITFKKDEKIHTEVSIKYSRAMIDSLVNDSGLHIKQELHDSRNFFCDLVLGK